MNEDYLLESYDFDLPERQIAQYPSQSRDQSRLLLLDRQGSWASSPRDALFSELPAYLPENALLVANNVRVLPARIKWRRPGGGKADFLLLSPLPALVEAASLDRDGFCSVKAEALLKPASRFQIGQDMDLCPNLGCKIVEKGEYGRHLVILRWKGDLEKIFNDNGTLPLPPYIKRESEFSDAKRYQTIYASKSGAIAAPTAGLHFSPHLRQKLSDKNLEWREISLYVGYGTFSPVRSENIRQHTMHKEYLEIDASTATAIREALEDGRPVISIGTTSLRALEGLVEARGDVGEYAGWTDIFIYPGFNFKVVDALITNFHLPKSSLLMLVSAFAGRKTILNAYAYAIRKGYRFFSYGDAMLIR